MAPDALDQLLTLTGHFGGPFRTFDDGHIATDADLGHFGGRDAQLLGTGRDSGDEVFAGLRGEGFEVVLIHG